MRLTVLGSSGTFPGPDEPCSSYLIEAEGFRLLIDAGSGAVAMLQRYGDLRDLDAVLVSHLHGDHVLDLVPYVYARAYHPAGPASRIPLYGPPGTDAHLTAAGATDRLPEVFDCRPLGPGDREIGPFRVRTERMNHPVECYGVRLEYAGRTLAYSADTGETEALSRLARGADLLLCEASYAEDGANPPGLHLTAGQAGGYAARAGVGALLLTHLVPWGDREASLAAAGSAYGGPLAAASSGDVREL